MSKLGMIKNYECDGQLSIFDYQEPVYELEIKGICDDPYCPKCGYAFWTDSNRNEVDCEHCPECHIKVDWTFWHRLNDDESQA